MKSLLWPWRNNWLRGREVREQESVISCGWRWGELMVTWARAEAEGNGRSGRIGSVFKSWTQEIVSMPRLSKRPLFKYTCQFRSSDLSAEYLLRQRPLE